MANPIFARTGAGALFPTSNAPAVSYTSGANFPWLSLNFDQTTPEKCLFHGTVNATYTAAADVTVKIFWTAAATGNVVWGVKYLGLIDDEVFDSALSAQSTVTDGVTAANDIMVGSITFSTPALAPDDYLVVELQRVAGDASDTLAADAKFLAIVLEA